MIDETSSGERNVNLASLIGIILKFLPKKYWLIIAKPLIDSWNLQKVAPPLPQNEVDRTFESIMKNELSTLDKK